MPEEISRIERRSPAPGNRSMRSSNSTKRNAQGFRCDGMVLGEILSHGGLAVAPVKHAHIRGWRLSHHECFQVVPLRGDRLVQRIIDQHCEKKSFSLAPVGD